MSASRFVTYFILVLLTLLSAGPVLGQQAGGAVTTGDQIAADRYIAGGSVQVSEEVEGDAVVAGGVINVSNSVSGDVLAAGGIVTVSADTGDDVRAAGGSVTIVGNVGNDVTAAGGLVNIDAGSTVGGNAWLAGRMVNVAGTVNRDLSASGGQVIVTGTIGGNVDVRADSIEIEPGAVIKGTLTYTAPQEAVLHDGAIVEGAVNRREFDPGDIETWGEAFSGTLKFYLSLALSAMVLFLVCPRSSARLLQPLKDAPFKSLGFGILVFFASPLIALALLISVLGIPLGLIVLMGYIVALVGGLLIAMIWTGGLVFRLLGQKPEASKWMRALSIIAAAAVLLIIDLIPVVGGLAFFALILLGFGALTLHGYGSEQA